MITNEELQQTLKQYPNDCAIAIAIKYNGTMGCYLGIEVDGIEIKGEKLVIFTSKDIEEEYTNFLDGITEGCVFNAED